MPRSRPECCRTCCRRNRDWHDFQRATAIARANPGHFQRSSQLRSPNPGHGGSLRAVPGSLGTVDVPGSETGGLFSAHEHGRSHTRCPD
jgi:hypothetical protein